MRRARAWHPGGGLVEGVAGSRRVAERFLSISQEQLCEVVQHRLRDLPERLTELAHSVGVASLQAQHQSQAQARLGQTRIRRHRRAIEAFGLGKFVVHILDVRAQRRARQRLGERLEEGSGKGFALAPGQHQQHRILGQHAQAVAHVHLVERLRALTHRYRSPIPVAHERISARVGRDVRQQHARQLPVQAPALDAKAVTVADAHPNRPAGRRRPGRRRHQATGEGHHVGVHDGGSLQHGIHAEDPHAGGQRLERRALLGLKRHSRRPRPRPRLELKRRHGEARPLGLGDHAQHDLHVHPQLAQVGG